MNAEQFREAARASIDDIIEYLKSLPNLRVTPSIKPGYLRPQLPEAVPEKPEPFSAVLSDIHSKIIPGLTHWQSPHFFAFFPATTTWPSILGEMFSAAFSAPAFNWLCSPACTELETVMMDWVANMIGLPECFLSTGSTNGGGVIQGSASEAIVVAMTAARDAAVRRVIEREGLMEEENESDERLRQREDLAAEVRGKLVAVGSEQTHSATQKSANILGVRFRSAKAGKATGFRMTGDSLRSKLNELKRQGLEPFYVTATMGTTATCAVDELGEIAEVRKEFDGLWVHVDAAYAGAALVCEEFRELAQSKYLGELDSFNFNMHKWLMTNFDASLLYLRDRAPVIKAMTITRSYLSTPMTGLVTDYRDWQIPLGRRFRALKIWFVLRAYGVEGLQKWIRNGVALGELFADLVRQRNDLFEIVAGPQFGLTVIRCLLARGSPASGMSNGVHIDAGGSGATPERKEDEMNGFEEKRGTARAEEENALTKQVSELINSRGDIFVTGAVAEGTYVIRFVTGNMHSEEKYVRRAFDILVNTTEEVLAARGLM